MGEVLQAGGFGTVLAAEVLGCPGVPDGFPIAVKHLGRRPKEQVIPSGPGGGIEDNFSQRVEREVALLSELNSARPQGFVKYLGHSYGSADAYVFMQRADLDLYTYVFENRQLDDGKWAKAADLYDVDPALLVHELLLSLGAIHRKRYAHRDIKLENLLLRCPHGERCVSLIADADTVCALDPGLPYPCADAAAPVGSPSNWPPEAWTIGREAWKLIPEAMDVWAVGLAICEVYLRVSCMPDVGQSKLALDLKSLANTPRLAAAMAERVVQHARNGIAGLAADPRTPWWVPNLLESMLNADSAARCTARECWDFVQAASPVTAPQLEHSPRQAQEHGVLQRVGQCMS